MANSSFKATFLWLNISRKANNSEFITYGDFGFIFMCAITLKAVTHYTRNCVECSVRSDLGKSNVGDFHISPREVSKLYNTIKTAI